MAVISTISTANPSNISLHADSKQAERIKPVTRQEAAQLALAEVNQVLNLLEQLDGDDWTQPTDCTEWNVHDMITHLAGACAGWASWKHFRRQLLLNPYMRTTDVPVDAINRRQLEDRKGHTSRQLIEELREMGPKAVRNRKNLPGLLRLIRIDAKPMPGKMSMGYLADVIYTRDQWMHRMDICRATGKTLVITPNHDDRLLDLVVLDMAKALAEKYALKVNVTGTLAASYRFGDDKPQAELDIDFLTLNRRASMRLTVEEVLQDVVMHGDRAVAKAFLQNCEVLY